MWTKLLTRYPANQVAPFSLLVPVVGLATGWVVYGEAMQPVHFAGAALLMLGLAANLWSGRLSLPQSLAAQFTIHWMPKRSRRLPK